MNSMTDLTHQAPEDYFYEYEQFNTRLVAIWLCCNRTFDYNLGKSTRTIWGFYNSKKREYYAPINATKCGDKVNISDTRNYTAMQIHKTPIELAMS
jgi:hypothetical protein